MAADEKVPVPEVSEAFPFPERSRLLEGVRAYGLIMAMWVRSTMAYRA
ncbi:transporter, partial [Streptomyces caelestis]